MSTDELKTPQIDSRDLNQLVDELSGLVEGLTAKVGGQGWVRSATGQHDGLGALVHIVSEISKQTIDSVNAIPDAGFSAYLDLIGARPAPPMPARVPLTFYLVENSPKDALVPASTQVGATPDPDSGITEELIFETEEELNVTRASVRSVVIHEPQADTLDDVSLVARGHQSGHYEAFSGHVRGRHELYLACDEVFSREGLTSLRIRIEFTKATSPEHCPLEWARFDGQAWRPVSATVEQQGKVLNYEFESPAPGIQSTLFGSEGYWLRARLQTEDIPGNWERADPNRMIRELPAVKNISVSSTCKIEGLVPSVQLHGSGAIDASSDFYPLGEVPEHGDTYYLDCGSAFAQPPGSAISLLVTLGEATADRPPKATEKLRLIWEVMTDEGGWTCVGRSSGTQSFAPLKAEPNQYGFADQTLALTKTGRVEFRLPRLVQRQKVGQRRGRWLRVRIARGSYGGFEQVVFNPNSQRYEVTPATLAPPLVESVVIGCEHSIVNAPLNRCLSSDLGFAREHKAPIAGAFSPFVVNPANSRHPSFFICLDRPPTRQTISFFVEVLPPDPNKATPDNYHAQPLQTPELRWDYACGDGWQRLGVRDTTNSFRERGTVRFVGPTDFTESTQFGIRGYWLRVQWVRGNYRHDPRVAKVLLNTVWASHCVTRRDEILGSGRGVAGELFECAGSPVLVDTILDVRELVRPSEEELTHLQSEVRAQRLTIIRDTTDSVSEVWVRWLSVPHFHESGPRDRHYTLDSSRGQITFGDGTYGMLLPRGQGNVRLTRYRTGGGLHGNRPEGAVSELKTSIPYVDSVTNHVAASGGTSSESPERVRERGPMKLRHRERAVTPSDYEDLALEAAPEVIRAHALMTPFNPIDLVINLEDLDTEGGAARTNAVGRIVLNGVPEDVEAMSQRTSTVHVVIVPNSDAPQPAPSLGLLERVDTYLRERAAPTVNLQVSGPRWIQVAVTAQIVPEPGVDPDSLVTMVDQAVQRYLHPLTGGTTGEGWSFGRAPQRSHLYRLIDTLPGVHHVRSLKLETHPPQPVGGESLSAEEMEALRGALIYSGAHNISLAPGSYEEL